MQTRFSPEQLEDAATARSEGAIRKCVHCGFCTATCPTYVLLGDEADSPRGRIYLIKEMLENERDPTPQDVLHIDRCLSCLACTTTCPSGVDYMHLIDHARAYVEERYRRPFMDRTIRGVLAFVMPRRWAFRTALFGARLARPLRVLLPKRLKAILELAPKTAARAPKTPKPAPPAEARLRVALLPGCVQPVLAPEINAAAERLLTRLGAEIATRPGPRCCGSLTHHLGKDGPARAAARKAIDGWIAEMDGAGLDAIAITASGCGVTIKDYPALFDDDPAYLGKARRVAAIAKDVSEVIDTLGLPEGAPPRPMAAAYHSACSLQHGQKIPELPAALLETAGFTLTPVAESHLCCGSAGTYNMLQPDIARRLGARKVANLERGRPDVIATGNIGCMTQIAKTADAPVVHTVELLDWATGGPVPPALAEAAETGE